MTQEIEFVIRSVGASRWLGILMVDGKEHSRNGCFYYTAELALITIVEHAKKQGFNYTSKKKPSAIGKACVTCPLC
jgi:hypothetical protein